MTQVGAHHFQEQKSMKNITVSVPDETYRSARVWAARRDTSVSAVVAYLLETLPGIQRARQAFPAAKSLPHPPPAAPESSENVLP
jgi:hypothetical protein